MADQGRDFHIEAGMSVVDRDGDRVGTLDTILSEDRTNVSRFIIVDRRILPVEGIAGAEGDEVKLGIAKDTLRELPQRRGDEMPTPDDQRQAYRALGLEGPLAAEPDEEPKG